MAVTFVSAGAEGSAASGNVTPGLPAGVQTDDILICVVHSSDQVSHSMSGDWTQIAQGNGGGTTSRLSVWWHRYAGVDPNRLVTHAAGQSPIAGIAAFRGCKRPGSPVHAAGSISGGTDASIEVTGFTTTVVSMLLLCFGAADDNVMTLLSPFAAALEDSAGSTQNCFQTTAGTPDGSVALFYDDDHAVETVTTKTVTQAAADPWASVMVALEPAPEATPNFISAGATVPQPTTAAASTAGSLGPGSTTPNPTTAAASTAGAIASAAQVFEPTGEEEEPSDESVPDFIAPTSTVPNPTTAAASTPDSIASGATVPNPTSSAASTAGTLPSSASVPSPTTAAASTANGIASGAVVFNPTGEEDAGADEAVADFIPSMAAVPAPTTAAASTAEALPSTGIVHAPSSAAESVPATIGSVSQVFAPSTAAVSTTGALGPGSVVFAPLGTDGGEAFADPAFIPAASVVFAPEGLTSLFRNGILYRPGPAPPKRPTLRRRL